MSRKTPRENKPNTEAFSKALARIEQARKTGATHLDLYGFGLTKLPGSIGRLTQLQELDLGKNRLIRLPEAISYMTQLKLLNLNRNQLIKLPQSMEKLKQLQIFSASRNRLKTLPSFISKLTKLQELYFSHNQLTALPESIGWLTELKELTLSNNQLVALPESIGQLVQLLRLDLHENQLTTLPAGLRNLKSLRELYLHRNKGLGLPVEVLGATRKEVSNKKAHPVKSSKILDYYFSILKGKRPLNEAKLILVGRGAVGKTSLVNRLVHNRFDQSEKKTEGIQITEWSLRLHRKEQVRLNIWDFGGQEIMHATHQFFLTQRSLYLLVLNGREGGEDADAEYWLKLIESFGGDSPVIVVLNKIKEHPFDLNRRALQQKYPIRDFVKTDCEDGTGIAELHKIIARETDRLPELRAAFPASWFTIKEQLAGMKKNYVSFDDYRSFCAEHGEHDKTAQEALAGYLHTLGIVLNYKDDPRLQDTHVLNPHWVTNGIYKILNSDRLEKQQGEIRLRELTEILDEKNYPTTMRRFIFDLMKKFDLCFSFPDDDTHYLIPELLDKQEPEAAAEFQPEACLNFQYHYSVLPEGLLPRFIVRTHVLSEGLPRWRTGVMLTFEGQRALVKADVQEKKVFISVAGPAAGRGRLLAIIRSDFERIHYDVFKTQPPLAMVPLPQHPQVVVPYRELLVFEEKGKHEFDKVVDDEVLTCKASELLNGVDLHGVCRIAESFETQREAARVFVSYAHKDERLCNELIVHLKLMHRQGWIATWHDRKIEAGENWKEKIDENLERADIILLLISADFMASDYCYEKEMKRALERHANNEATVIPVIVRDCNWQIAPLAKLQALPKEGKAVKKWPDKDSAWRNVAEGIERVVEEIRKKSR